MSFVFPGVYFYDFDLVLGVNSSYHTSFLKLLF